MQQLLYAGEVRSMKEIEIPETEVKDAELKLAKQLIDAQAVDAFDPAAYADEVSKRIEAAIQQKVEGQEISLSEAPEAGAQVIDLMEALRASLDRKPAGKGALSKAAPAKAAASEEERKPAKRARVPEPVVAAPASRKKKAS